MGSPQTVAVHREMPMQTPMQINAIGENKQIRLWLNMNGISF
jgi:hypothetical protein